ncbi:unnamed protein product [Sphagnum balticum]
MEEYTEPTEKPRLLKLQGASNYRGHVKLEYKKRKKDLEKKESEGSGPKKPKEKPSTGPLPPPGTTIVPKDGAKKPAEISWIAITGPEQCMPAVTGS